MKLTYNDKQHAYWLDGKRCKGVTGVAAYPQDRYSIEQWRARMIVSGMAQSPPLVHRAQAHFDEREHLEAIAEEALNIAKANEAAGRGTANHRIAERVDLGLTVIETEESGAVIEAWRNALDEIGVDIVPELIERIVIYPDLLIAGRFDRIGRYRHSGRHVSVDIKTGANANAIRYPHSVAIQLALYANAPLMAGPLQPGKNGTDWTDQFEPLPEDLHRDHGIVIYLPPEGPAQCPRVNIAAGWEAAQQICFPTIAWRNRKDLIEFGIPTVIDPTKVDSSTRNQYATTSNPGSVIIAGPYMVVDEPINPDAHAWLHQRVETIKAAGYGGPLAAAWSGHVDIPTFPKGGPRTKQEFDVIHRLCDGIEAQYDIPFGPSDPTIPKQTKSTLGAKA